MGLGLLLRNESFSGRKDFDLRSSSSPLTLPQGLWCSLAATRGGCPAQKRWERGPCAHWPLTGCSVGVRHSHPQPRAGGGGGVQSTFTGTDTHTHTALHNAVVPVVQVPQVLYLPAGPCKPRARTHTHTHTHSFPPAKNLGPATNLGCAGFLAGWLDWLGWAGLAEPGLRSWCPAAFAHVQLPGFHGWQMGLPLSFPSRLAFLGRRAPK